MVHQEAACPRPLPRRLDRYDLLEVLGSGTFGAVYRASHIMTGDSVAVKVLRPTPEGQSVDTARLVGEARAMSAVRHPHVVRVLDAGIADTTEGFVVMELAEGTSLQQLVEQGLLQPARAADLAQQMLEGLAAVHAQGIVHRDIKPSNVLVSPRLGKDFVRLLDFGISKVPSMGMMTLPGSSMGTPGFMAPELFGNAAGADLRADIYGVAATLFYILSGRLPFEAQTYEDLVVLVRTQRAPPLSSVAPHVPPQLGDVIDRGLARDRDARWPDALSFAAALGAAASGGVAASALATHISGMPQPMASHSSAMSPTIPAAMPYAMQPVMSGPLLTPMPPPMMSPMPPPMMSPMALDTSTGRAAPPVGVSIGAPAPSLMGWMFGMAAGAGLLVLVAATAFMVMKMRNGNATEPPTSTSTPTPTSTSTPTSTLQRTRISFGPPKVVGRVTPAAFATLTAHATPAAQRCGVTKHEVALIDLFIQASGEITLAQRNVSNLADDGVVDCVGNAFRDAASKGWKPGGEGGIVTVSVTLDPG